MGYHVDILQDVTAKGWSTVVDPMAKDCETCMFWCTHAAVSAGVAARLLQAAGETVFLWLQWRLRCWMPSPACWRCRCRVSVETYLVNMLGCRLCEFWSVSLSRVRSIVEWKDVWVQCVLLFLRFQFLCPCSCHLMSLCGSWCWSCGCSLRSSIKRLLMWSASVAPVLMAYSSASALERAIVACVASIVDWCSKKRNDKSCCGSPCCWASCSIAVHKNVEIRDCFCWKLHCWSDDLLVVLCSFDVSEKVPQLLLIGCCWLLQCSC